MLRPEIPSPLPLRRLLAALALAAGNLAVAVSWAEWGWRLYTSDNLTAEMAQSHLNKTCVGGVLLLGASCWYLSLQHLRPARRWRLVASFGVIMYAFLLTTLGIIIAGGVPYNFRSEHHTLNLDDLFMLSLPVLGLGILLTELRNFWMKKLPEGHAET